ncbi:MAG TPA: MFS transporter [Bacillus bacterium]|uniref:MFS transporter n=1 Tax=Siminovitchia fordii TaxID=254759 RepID=A0ABQ4K7W9_9BACI|nr:MFS transporter [Siminovitchia fordii]GIN21243.1 MFS transporter [Siminovitchia fordii]HBZ10699.1 MFS transporter [Bacillus sp. (in: firmicutes)]
MDFRKLHVESSQNFKWFVLIVATLSQTCASFVIFGMGPMAAFYQQTFNLSQFETGMIVSTVNIGPIISMIIFGNMMDKYGEKWVVGLGSILLGLNTFIAYLIDSYIVLLTNLLFVGIWYGTAQPGGSSAIVKWFPRKHRGLAMGIRQTGIPVGGALAAISLPFFFYRFGLEAAILLQAFIATVGGLIFLLIYKNPGTEIQPEHYTFKEKIIRIKNNSQLYPVLFIGMTMVSVQLIIVAHLMGYLKKMLGLDLELAGSLLSLALIGGTFGRLILAWISDNIFAGNRSKPLLLTIWSTVFIILLFLSGMSMPLWGIGLLCFFFGFLGIGWYSLFIVMIAEKSDKNFIGLTVSFALTINQFFIVASPALFGLLVDWTNGYFIPFAILAVAISAGGIWLRMTEQKISEIL